MEQGNDLDIWKDASIDNGPPAVPSIDGPSNGKPNTEYDYAISSTDPESENVYYYVDWGDGSSESDLGPYSSGEIITKRHKWTGEEVYTIRVKAKDTNGLESDWSTFEMSTPVTRENPRTIGIQIIERILERFPLLREILYYISTIL
jgi:hypothetical protein